MSEASMDPRLMMQAALDGELDAAGALAFERQRADDPALAKEFQRLQALRRVLRENFADEAAPAALRARVAARARPARGFSRREAFSLAASLAMGVVLGGGAMRLALGERTAPGLTDALVDAHRRALLAAGPVDIASNDRHSVRPWFDAHIAVSPPAPDLAAQGFPLVGGRVDVIEGAAAPTLVYRLNEHTVSVTALPTARAATPGASPAGYHVLAWRGEDFSYWAVSDADEPRLQDFVRAFRAATNSEPASPQ
jgi:anti-sigma factor RsiW